MNIKEAKIWVKLNPEELKLIGRPNLAKQYEFLEAFSKGEKLECYFSDGIWKDTDSPTFRDEFKYRVKQIETINNTECPMPENQSLKLSQTYYCEDPASIDLYIKCFWQNTKMDYVLLNRGLIHLNKENAIKCCKARYFIK